MTGMDRVSGKPLADLLHLRQSITDILSTPIDSRIMRRDYGSRLFKRVDVPSIKSMFIHLSHDR